MQQNQQHQDYQKVATAVFFRQLMKMVWLQKHIQLVKNISEFLILLIAKYLIYLVILPTLMCRIS